MPAALVSTIAPLLAMTSTVCDWVLSGMVMSSCKEPPTLTTICFTVVTAKPSLRQ